MQVSQPLRVYYASSLLLQAICSLSHGSCMPALWRQIPIQYRLCSAVPSINSTLALFLERLPFHLAYA